MNIMNAFARAFLVVLVAATVVVPQVAMADYIPSNSYKPVSVPYSGGSNPVVPTYYSNPKPSTYYSYPQPSTYYSYPKQPSYYSYPSYSYNYPNYSYKYPSYSNYSSCGSYYNCGSGSGGALNLIYNENDNDNTNNNSNVNQIHIGSLNDDDDDDDRDDDEPWCELDVDDSSVEENDRVELSWDTRNADYASINQGIGRVDEDGGSLTYRVDDEDITFRMTVRDDDGDEETCSVSVNVDEDEDNDFSSVVYVDEPSNNPPPTVYLSSIPYTGLEDLTPEVLMYWLLLIAGIGGAVFYAMTKGLLPNVFAYALPEGHVEEETISEEAPSEGHINEFVSSLEAGDTDTVMDYLRAAAVDGTGVEEFLAEARSMVSVEDPIAAKLDAMLEGSRMTGIRGAKAALA